MDIPLRYSSPRAPFLFDAVISLLHSTPHAPSGQHALDRHLQPHARVLPPWRSLVDCSQKQARLYTAPMLSSSPTPDSPFDAHAEQWDSSPVRGERARTVASEIMRRLPSGGRWLDIGSGTGLLGLALSAHADHVSLGDTSQGMLEVARRNIADAGLNDRMDVLFCNAEQWSSEVPSQEYDAIVSLMALHHMENQRSVIRALVERVRPGGWVALADMDADDGSYHADGDIVPAHHGTERALVEQLLRECDCQNVLVSTVMTISKSGRDYPVFLATAQVAQR